MLPAFAAAAVVGWCVVAPPLVPPPCCSSSRTASARALMMAADDEGGGGELIRPGNLDNLRARIARIQERNGEVATPAEKLFELATQKPPSVLLRDFFESSSPSVQQAMQDAIASLLGALPPYEFDSQITTTGDKMAALMLQLQMTGYMLRNA
eukprot:7377244-Prymnesium_polylepis.1